MNYVMIGRTAVSGGISGMLARTRKLAGRIAGGKAAPMVVAAVAAMLNVGVADAQDWAGSLPADAKGKTVYLWNVGQQKFLGKGGNWGTEATVATVGIPFTLSQNSSEWFLQSTVKQQDGTTNGYLTFMDGQESEHDKGNFFVDRAASATLSSLTFTAVEGKSNVYNITVTSSNTSADADYQGTFYLYANNGKLEGEKTIATAEDAQWIIVTEQERKDYFSKVLASDTKPAGATFLVKDNDFARNDLNVSNWKTGADQSGTLANGTENVTPDLAVRQTETVYTYTYSGQCLWTYTTILGDHKEGYHDVTKTVTTTKTPDEMPTDSVFTCDGFKPATFHTHSPSECTLTLDNSKTTSVVNVVREGYTYYVGNGLANGDEQETTGDKWTASIHGSNGTVTQTIAAADMVRKGYYRVSCTGFTTTANGTAYMFANADNGNGGEKTVALNHIEGTVPTTYVGGSEYLDNTANHCDVRATVYVDDNQSLSFGVGVDNADANAWTCFDNFQVEYLGDINETLVLDELQTSTDYLNNQRTETGKANVKRTLYLSRTLNAGKWNSIVLPVSLTAGQVKDAFGSVTLLSEFKGADEENPSRIIFSGVNLDRDNDDNVAIEAGHLYIVKPEGDNAMPENQTPQQAEGMSEAVTSYYTIVGVPFVTEETEIPAMVEQDASLDGQTVKFRGTYVNHGDELFIPANSYVLSGKQTEGSVAGLWYFRTVGTKTKGFRGWLEATQTDSEKKTTFVINGIEDTTTAIDNVTFDTTDGNKAGCCNVYNLNGQLVRRGTTSTEGLASGIYVAGGKKVVVK